MDGNNNNEYNELINMIKTALLWKGMSQSFNLFNSSYFQNDDGEKVSLSPLSKDFQQAFLI